MSKLTISIVSLLIAAAILGAYFYPGSTIVQLAGATSPVGVTFNTAKYAGTVMVPATASATTSTILNGDASDRYVTQVRTACQGVGTSLTPVTGAGLAALTLTIGTSSTATPLTVKPALSVAILTIATTSPSFQLASTTLQANVGTSTLGMIWAAGSYMAFGYNATNTATCTVGVDYIGA